MEQKEKEAFRLLKEKDLKTTLFKTENGRERGGFELLVDIVEENRKVINELVEITNEQRKFIIRLYEILAGK